MKIFPLILIGIILLVIIPVNAGPNSTQIITSTPTLQASAGIVNNGPFAGHCAAGGANCAVSLGMLWTNPNGILLPVVLDHIVLNLQLVGAAPSGVIDVYVLPADTSGKPTSNSQLATSAVSISAIPASITLVSFTFTGSNTMQISPNTNYALALVSLNTTNWSSNQVRVWGDSSACSGSGAGDYQFQSNAWGTVGAVCLTYQVWVNPQTTVTQVNNSIVVGSAILAMLVIIIAVGFIFTLIGVIKQKVSNEKARGISPTVSFGLGCIFCAMIFLILLALMGVFSGVFSSMGV